MISYGSIIPVLFIMCMLLNIKALDFDVFKFW